jgi:hypothetical protein
MYQAEFHLGDIPKNAKPSDFILSGGDDSMASFRRLHLGFDERALVGLIESCIRDKGCAMSTSSKPENRI